MNPKVGGSNPPWGWDIFSLKNYDSKTPIHPLEFKMIAVAQARLTISNINFANKDI